MARYDYKCEKHGDIYEVTHSINLTAFKTMKELREYVIENSKEGEEGEIIALSESEHEEGHPECFNDECGEVARVILECPPVIFKGMGWPSNDAKFGKYPGKNKKMYERMREDRLKRRGKETSTDAIINMGLDKFGVTDNIVPNKKWDSMPKELQFAAHSKGFRPSREFRR